ncbi:MAG: lipid A export permease/ATP-binding protein MsbA, partial [Gammaproteobacteria bacterium]|nr:lipid A export permease/ATP-binding protein MsbA [Gammaproteobacteria bacterium]
MSEKSSAQIYRRLLGYVAPHWKIFVLASIALALVAGSQTSFVALMKPMLDGSFVERDPDIIKYTPWVMMALFLVRGLGGFISSYFMAWMGREVIKKMRAELFDQLLRLPVSFYDVTPSGSLISKFIYDVEQVAQSVTSAITVLVRDTLTVIGLLGYMFYINWILASIMLIGGPIIGYVINVISKRFRRYSTRIQNSMGDVTQVAEEVIEGQRVIKTFGGQAYELQRFDDINEHNRHLNMKMETTNAASVPVVQFISASASAAVIYVATSEPFLETLTVGTFVSFIAAMMMMYGPMKSLTQINATLQRGIAAAQSIFNFIDMSPEIDDGTVEMKSCNGSVVYQDIHFNYGDDGEEVLQGIGFEAKAGQTVAFVGRSGSGKSTLVNLLPRFYLPKSGVIRIDGYNIENIRLQDLRDQISLVNQHITLFNDTIENNIAYGRLGGANRDDVIKAAKAAHAMEFIERLPEGLDTLVGENGVLLSGGQRQRLAIARALLKNAPILILDEATSALDTESEQLVQDAIIKLMQNRTSIVIAHRLSTIKHADQILVIDEGRIVERGTHNELIRKPDGLYHKLHT